MPSVTMTPEMLNPRWALTSKSAMSPSVTSKGSGSLLNLLDELALNSISNRLPLNS